MPSKRFQCSYECPRPFRTTAFCRQSARWLVEYTTPDDGKHMRRRAVTIRCLKHTETKFLPEGASQVTTSLMEGCDA